MTRRTLLALFAGRQSAPERVPVDPAELNAFVAQFNAYVMLLKDGRVDLRQWERVVRAWEKIAFRRCQ